MFKLAVKSLITKYIGFKEITEKHLQPLLKNIGDILLSSDVHTEVVKGFLKKIEKKILTDRHVGIKNLEAYVLNVIRQELIDLLGGGVKDGPFAPKRVLLVGLNGSGKTSSAAKLSLFLSQSGIDSVLNVGLDFMKPGAIEQLRKLSEMSNIAFCEPIPIVDGEVELAISKTITKAIQQECKCTIFDTAGTLEDLKQVSWIQKKIKPDSVLFVLDAMAGQEVVDTIQAFHQKLNITGLIVTKVDSECPMGAAFSINYLLGIPIRFLSEGENIKDFAIFHPERITQRILGEGDILSLSEKINTDKNINTNDLMTKIMNGRFDLNDLLLQYEDLQKMGSLKGIMKFLPTTMDDSSIEFIEQQLKIWKTLINSMTMKEKKNPKLFKKEHSRKIRVIKGSGRKPDELNKLLKKWEESKQKMMELTNKFRRNKNLLSMFPSFE